MQQTSKYQFNLVDTTDDFSPAPLNQNTQKAEAILTGVEVALANGLETVEEGLEELKAGLGSGGHNARIAWGTYTGTGTYGASNPTVFSCDFYPLLVVVEWQNYQYGHPLILARGVTTMPTNFNGYHTVTVAWGNTQVEIYTTVSADVQFNMAGEAYHYVILGYSSN